MSQQKVFVIVGAGLAGANAAIALRKNGFDGRVILVGEEPDPPYNRPPLSKGYLRGEERFDDIRNRKQSAYDDSGIEMLLSTRANRILPAEHRLELSTGAGLNYDRLLVVTGAVNVRPAIPGIDLDGVFQLRRRHDSDAIREAARPGSRAAVIGLGFIGCEVSASLRQLGVEVTAVEFAPQPLARPLGERLGERVGRLHRDHGVDMRLGDGVESFEGTGRVQRVRTKAGAVIECDFTVVGLGARPDVELLAEAGAGIDNGVLVDEFCRTSLPDVYAAGDVANRLHPRYGRIRIEHWNNADRAGRFAARNMLDKAQPFDDIPSFWSDQYDTSIEYVGHHGGPAEIVVRGDIDSDRFVAFYVQEGRVPAAFSIGFGDDLVGALEVVVGANQVIPEGLLRDESVELADLVTKVAE